MKSGVSRAEANKAIIQSTVSDLIPYINNARTHSAEQVSQIAASIKEFGFTNPVLIDGNNGIIAGHGRVQAAIKLDMIEVPTICLDTLTKAQVKAYILADNRLAESAGWDNDLLRIEIDDLKELDFDIDLIGFNPDELMNILDNVNFDPGTEEEQGQLDQLEPKIVDCPHCGKEFDLREC